MAAKSAEPSGESPRVSARAVAGYGYDASSLNSSEDEQRSGGGCGSVSDVDWKGGNGLLFLASLYFVFSLVKRMRHRQKEISSV